MEEGGSAGTVDRHRNEINSRNEYSNRKNNKLKLSMEVEVVINDEVVENESAVVGARVLREKTLEEKKRILINSLQNKECDIDELIKGFDRRIEVFGVTKYEHIKIR